MMPSADVIASVDNTHRRLRAILATASLLTKPSSTTCSPTATEPHRMAVRAQPTLVLPHLRDGTVATIGVASYLFNAGGPVVARGRRPLVVESSVKLYGVAVFPGSGSPTRGRLTPAEPFS